MARRPSYGREIGFSEEYIQKSLNCLGGRETISQNTFYRRAVEAHPPIGQGGWAEDRRLHTPHNNYKLGEHSMRCPPSQIYRQNGDL